MINRGGSRATATSKMECFVIIVNGFSDKPVETRLSYKMRKICFWNQTF